MMQHCSSRLLRCFSAPDQLKARCSLALVVILLLGTSQLREMPARHVDLDSPIDLLLARVLLDGLHKGVHAREQDCEAPDADDAKIFRQTEFLRDFRQTSG